MVSPDNGCVYVLWVDYDKNEIRMSTSTNCGQNWSSPETDAVIDLATLSGTYTIMNTTFTNTVTSNTLKISDRPMFPFPCR